MHEPDLQLSAFRARFVRAECGVVVEEGRGWVRAPAVAFCRGGANGGGGSLQLQNRRGNNAARSRFDACTLSAERLYRAMEDAARQWVARRGCPEGRHSDLAFFSRGR